MGLSILYLTYPLNALLMMGMPIALAVYLTRRFKLDWGLFGVGAVTFVLSQVGHIPFNLLLNRLFTLKILPLPPTAYQALVFAVIGGLSAGLWEELARYAAYRWWAKDARSWGKGLLLGAGHGGAEAMILGALVMYSFFRLVALRGADLSTLLPPEQLDLGRQQIAAYWSASWSASLAGAVERFFSIIVQLALSILVLQVFTRRQIRWLWLAIAWHTLADAVAISMARSLGLSGMWTIEAVIGVFALLSIGIIFALRQPEPVEAGTEPLPQPTALPSLPPKEETAENLEETRFG